MLWNVPRVHGPVCLITPGGGTVGLGLGGSCGRSWCAGGRGCGVGVATAAARRDAWGAVSTTPHRPIETKSASHRVTLLCIRTTPGGSHYCSTRGTGSASRCRSRGRPRLQQDSASRGPVRPRLARSENRANQTGRKVSLSGAWVPGVSGARALQSRNGLKKEVRSRWYRVSQTTQSNVLLLLRTSPLRCSSLSLSWSMTRCVGQAVPRRDQP